MNLHGIELKAGMQVKFSSLSEWHTIFPASQFSHLNRGNVCRTEFIALTASGWMHLDYEIEEIRDLSKLHRSYIYILNPKSQYTTVWKREDDIVIGDNSVVFEKDGIQVGCTKVSKETIEKIYRKINSIK